jgi:hypothetical protein
MLTMRSERSAPIIGKIIVHEILYRVITSIYENLLKFPFKETLFFNLFDVCREFVIKFTPCYSWPAIMDS